MKLNKLYFKFFISLFIAWFISTNANAQVENPITWEISKEIIDDENLYIVINADIKDGWELYSQFFEPGGPKPLEIIFEESDRYTLIGITEETYTASENFDDVFLVDYKYFTEKAEFKQKISLNTTKGFNISGFIEGQACFSASGMCIPINYDIFLPINGGETTDVQEEGCDISRKTPVLVTNNPYKTFDDTGSLFAFFMLSLLFGLLAILTPCVFPMIPMTVSFFMQKSINRLHSIIKALIFGVSIVLLYTLVGLIISLTSAGADFTSMLSSNWIPNLIFFILFIVFAASLFGLFELVLPSSLVNKADSQIDKGGNLASFFLALTTVIVSFSCTGPIVGALLVEATTGSVIMPSVGMFGFGLGFAIPFTILAISPRWIDKLPKSGGWLNSVKVVMGFLILAFSLKFLSNIDQNYHLNLLSRDFYIAIWIVIFVLLGLYLLGKIKFAHDSEVKHVGFVRLIFVIISFTIAIYLFPGLFGANLSTISGLLPPKTDQRFDLSTSGMDIDSEFKLCERPEYADRLSLPYQVQAYYDYMQAIDCAKEQNKPLLLYFTGHTCSNCKKMQGEVWSDERVRQYFNNDFVLTALYVDDRVIEMDESRWFISKNDDRIKKRLGEVNADIQIVNFNNNTQPYYVTISPDGEVLAPPMSYNNNVDEFINFLEESLENFNP